MKVKVKRVRAGSMGDQRQYGLVTGSVWNYENKQTTNNVGTTLSPVPREEATIEAERGETVIGDLDNDGMVEHAKIGGKRHPQGGTPLNVPDGSFVYSDYRGLLIKNKDLLKGIFNMSTNKAVTPAKVAQRYDLNRYKALLNDPDSDAMTKKTAQLMIDNNMKKLGQLALVQEGMKGFPDGIPAIAMPLLGPDFQHPQGSAKMKKGGSVQYKKGGGLSRAQNGEESKFIQYPGDKNKYQYETLDDLEKRLGRKLIPHSYGEGVFYDPGDPNVPEGIRRSGQFYYVNPRTGNVGYIGGINPESGNLMPLPKFSNTGYASSDEYFKSYWESLDNFKGWQTSDGKTLDKWQPGAQPKLGVNDEQASLIGILGATGFTWAAANLGKGIWNLAKWSRNLLKSGKTAADAAKAADAAADAQKAASTVNRWGKVTEEGWQASKAADEAYEAAYAAAQASGATVQEAEAAAQAYTKWQQAKDFYASTPILRQLLPWAGVAAGYGILDATTDIFSGPTPVDPNKTPLKTNTLDSGAVYTVPSVAGDTGKIAKANRDSAQMFNLFKQLYPTASDKDIQEMMRDSIKYNLADSMFRQPPVTDSLKVNKDSISAAQAQAAAQAAREAQAQAAAVAKAKAEAKAKAKGKGTGKKIKIKGVNYYPNDTTGTHLWPKETGGELQRFADTGQFTQLIPETALQNTDKYDVIMPNKKFGSFDIQHYDPNLGYYTVTNSRTRAQEALDVDDFMTRHDNILQGYGSGAAGWKTDAMSRNENTRKKAVGWFQNKYNEWRRANGLSDYFINKSGPYGLDNLFGIYTWSAPGIKEKAKKVETKTEKPKEEEIVSDDPNPPSPEFEQPTSYNLGQWFPSDQAAMIAAAGMKIPDYHAYYGLPNPSLMMPVYRNENYEPISAVSQVVEGLGTGPEARGSALGVTGKGLKAASDIQQQTEALNTDQFLKTQAQNAQTINQFALLGEKEKSDYMNSINAIAKENAMNENAKSAGFASAFGKGYNNVLNQMLINAQYPYQFQTPYSVTVNPTLKSIYDNPITGGSSGGSYDDIFDYYHKMFSQPEYGLTKKEAIDAANSAARNHLNSLYQRTRGTGTNGAILSPFGD